MAGDSPSGDAIQRTLKSIYGYQDGGPEPYGWRQMSLKLAKLISSAEQGKKDSEDPADVKQFIVEAISEEIIRLARLHDSVAAVEAQRNDHNLAAARVPSQDVSDR